MNTKKSKIKSGGKLELSRETLRTLDKTELADVAGGARSDSRGCISETCPPPTA